MEQSADLHTAQLMPLSLSCFSKIQIGFTFLVPAHPGSPEQRAVKRTRVCTTRQCTLWPCVLSQVGVLLKQLKHRIAQTTPHDSPQTSFLMPKILAKFHRVNPNGGTKCRCKKGKGSPCSIAKRRVPELIPVLGSQPAGDANHEPGGRLPSVFENTYFSFFSDFKKT